MDAIRAFASGVAVELDVASGHVVVSAPCFHAPEDGESLTQSSPAVYYAMYHAAQAALLARGIDASSHRGLISLFGERLVKEGPLPGELGRSLSRAFRQRNVGEYEPTRPVPDDEAHQLLQDDREFVERIRADLADR